MIVVLPVDVSDGRPSPVDHQGMPRDHRRRVAVEVVQADDFVIFAYQSVAKMASQEASTTG